MRFLGFKESSFLRFQGFEVCRNNGFRFSRYPGFEVSKNQDFRFSKYSDFLVSRSLEINPELDV
jgi:hypothetical protein